MSSLDREPESGDIVIYETKQTFPQEKVVKRRSVVESYDSDEEVADLGIDGTVSVEKIVEIVGKSPSVDGE